MSLSSLESGFLAHVIARNPHILDVTVNQMQNPPDVSANQMQGHFNGRVINYIAQIVRSLPSQIDHATTVGCCSCDSDNVGKTALKIMMLIPEGFLLYGASMCKNDPQNWSPCGLNYSDEVGADIYAALAVAYPLIVTLGICCYIQRS